jgi:hypothetical protein
MSIEINRHIFVEELCKTPRTQRVKENWRPCAPQARASGQPHVRIVDNDFPQTLDAALDWKPIGRTLQAA